MMTQVCHNSRNLLEFHTQKYVKFLSTEFEGVGFENIEVIYEKLEIFLRKFNFLKVQWFWNCKVRRFLEVKIIMTSNEPSPSFQFSQPFNSSIFPLNSTPIKK